MIRGTNCTEHRGSLFQVHNHKRATVRLNSGRGPCLGLGAWFFREKRIFSEDEASPRVSSAAHVPHQGVLMHSGY